MVVLGVGVGDGVGYAVVGVVGVGVKWVCWVGFAGRRDEGVISSGLDDTLNCRIIFMFHLLSV